MFINFGKKNIIMNNTIFIIGLPGSGKSTYASSKYGESIVFDDFITTFATGEINNVLKNKKRNLSNIVLIDPRLCKIIEFQKFYAYIKQFVPSNSIEVILFENDVQKCVLNKPKLKELINKLSEEYSIENIIKCLDNNNYTILPCYSEDT